MLELFLEEVKLVVMEEYDFENLDLNISSREVSRSGGGRGVEDPIYKDKP